MPTATSVCLRCTRTASATATPRIVARKLVGDAAAARAALQRPDQRLGARIRNGCSIEPERCQPLPGNGQVLILAERVEAHPQTETIGQRDLLLHHLARVHLAVVGVRIA